MWLSGSTGISRENLLGGDIDMASTIHAASGMGTASHGPISRLCASA